MRERLGFALGLAMSAVPLLVSRTPLGWLLGGLAALLVAAAGVGVRWADGAAAVSAAGAAAVGVLTAAPYPAAGCLAVGVLGYAYLAVSDAGAPVAGWIPAWGLPVTVTALAGGALSVVVLVAAAVAPDLPGWSVAVAAVVLLAAALVALQRPE